jgi:hypothetical protein
MSKDRANTFRRGLAVIALGAVCTASLIALTYHGAHDVAVPSTEGGVAPEVQVSVADAPAARPAAPIEASPAPAAPAAPAPPAAPPATSLALLRRSIERRVDQGPKHRLSKADLRPRMKVVMRLLDRCYGKALSTDPKISGVVNTGLTIRSDPTLGISLTVTGFDTDGRLGESKEFLSCVTTTLESNVLPPLPTLGTIEVTYPLTFDPGGVDHHDTAIVDDSVRAANQGRCAEAVAAAERGLKRTWLAGPLRHSLIEVAGTCACRLKDELKARHYLSLASPEFEGNIVRACTAVNIKLLE